MKRKAVWPGSCGAPHASNARVDSRGVDTLDGRQAFGSAEALSCDDHKAILEITSKLAEGASMVP